MNIYLVIYVVLQGAVYVHGIGGYLPDVECQKIKEHNIASVTSSSLRPANDSNDWNAVDGVKETDMSKQGCFHSGDLNGEVDKSPWWSVTYKVPFQVEGVVITNRQDCCGKRLSQINVTVDTVLCATFNPNPFFVYPDPGAEVKLKCASALTGKTVKISKVGEYLTLCQVEVMRAN